MLRRLAPCGSGHRDHTSVATPERRAALISWGLPRQQGSLLTKVNERTGEWGNIVARVAAPPGQELEDTIGPDLATAPPHWRVACNTSIEVSMRPRRGHDEATT